VSYLNSIFYSTLRLAERTARYGQGKGYGAATVSHEVREVLKKLARVPSLAVDIGGNKGVYTLEIRRRFPACEIHIFEPAAANLEVLGRVFADDANVRVLPYAVSDKAEVATLYADFAGSGLASLSKRRLDHLNITMDHHESVRMIRFGDYWRDELARREIDVVKLDIEGHEFDALKAFGEDALARTRVLQFEFGGCNIDTRTFFQDFFYFFHSVGFDVHRISPFGVQLLDAYRESDECFVTTNFIATNRRHYTR
jgi:FkbM family methyltransferase